MVKDVQVSVVVPLYQDEGNVAMLYEALTAVFSQLAVSHEFIFIDDGSTDSTFERAKAFYLPGGPLRLFRLKENVGQYPAVFAGFERARGKIIVTIDSDLQTPADNIPQLLKKLDEGFDMVCGWRKDRKDLPHRLWGSWTINKMVTFATGIPMHDHMSMIRAFRRELIQRILQHPERCKALPVMSTLLSASPGEVVVTHRRGGASRYTFSKLFRVMLHIITSLIVFPIHKVGKPPRHPSQGPIIQEFTKLLKPIYVIQEYLD